MTVDALAHSPPVVDAQKETPHEGRGAQGKTLNQHPSTQGNRSRVMDDPFGKEPDAIYPSANFAPISPDEMTRARLTPRVIVPDLLYADVRIRNAAGGTGKTTMALFEAATVAMGRQLWGRDTGDTRRTVIITREDSREILAARLREVMRGMGLSDGDIAHVLNMVRIIDVSGERFRLSTVIDDVVEPHQANIDWLTAQLESLKPDWLIFDPLVSFGVGEGRVNDAEQGLIEAFRIFRNRLDCCVEGIHHTGKANARDKTLDQYSGRGGSALADGARMVVVMQPLEAGEWDKATGSSLMEGESGMVMALPKLSYAKKQDEVYIARNGYRFEMVRANRRTPEQAVKDAAERVHGFLEHEYRQGRRYCNRDIENMTEKIGMPRQKIREALIELKSAGRAIYHEVKGKPGSHWQPVTLAEGDGVTWGK